MCYRSSRKPSLLIALKCASANTRIQEPVLAGISSRLLLTCTNVTGITKTEVQTFAARLDKTLKEFRKKTATTRHDVAESAPGTCSADPAPPPALGGTPHEGSQEKD